MLNVQNKIKLRCCISFQQIKIDEIIRSKIEFSGRFLVLTLFTQKTSSLEMIQNFFSPIRHNQTVFYINYSLIKTVQTTEEQNLFFVVFNPVMHIDITFTASQLEEQGIVFHKKLKRIQITSTMRQILTQRVTISF